MTNLTQVSFQLLKPNARQEFSCHALYTEIFPEKQAKLNDVKSLFNYLRQESMTFNSNIPETTTADNDSDDD